MTEDREKLIRRYTDEVWNKGNVDLCDDIFETHASIHDPSFPVNGVKGIKDQVRQLRVAQPDFRLDVHDVLVAGDMTPLHPQRDLEEGVPWGSAYRQVLRDERHDDRQVAERQDHRGVDGLRPARMPAAARHHPRDGADEHERLSVLPTGQAGPLARPVLCR